MDLNERPEEGDESKLRRWVANLQLESWQLELLITGFSIFLLNESIGSYAAWSEELRFNKLVPTNSANAVFLIMATFLINAIPYAIKFFLISLLIHLLLRGFWIGIVGLSSVSSNIGLHDMNLRGPFRKYLPGKVQSLDELILYLDKIASVIFAYTYLLAFSIISVVMIGAFLFLFVGIGTLGATIFDNPTVAVLVSIISVLIGFLLAIAAIIFFLDTIFFSAFKKSKWFSVLYFPIYRFFSIISLSFIYRSIYYHLINNYKKKQIIQVTLILVGVVFISFKIEDWDRYAYYPKEDNSNGYFFQARQYDDERWGGYIRTASIPSKIVKGNFLELFIRYSPRDNMALDLLCPEYAGLENDPTILDSFNAGMESAIDSTFSVNAMLYDSDYEDKVNLTLSCFKELFEVKLNGKIVILDEVFFMRHENKNEKGIMTMLDISSLSAGVNMIEIKKKRLDNNPFVRNKTAEDLKFMQFVKIPFWKEPH